MLLSYDICFCLVCSKGANTLVVTHGDLFNLYLPPMAWAEDIGRFKAEEAGFAVLKGPEHGPCVESDAKILELHRAAEM